MINLNIEESMYDKFIDKGVLTTQELLGVGFTNEDLTQLVQDGKLRMVKRGYYELPIVDGLFLYTKTLFQKKNYDRGKLALKRCLDIDFENDSVNLRVMFNALRDEDYEQVFKCLDVLGKTDNEFYQHDQNMWVYLLGFITEIPERYKDKLKSIEYKNMDVLAGDRRFADNDVEKRLRGAIAGRNFYTAKQLSCIPMENYGVNSMITKKLVCLACESEKKRRNELLTLVANGEYEELVSMLDCIAEYYGLSYLEKCIYLLAEDLISIMKNKTIPIVDYRDTTDIQTAIKNHCYYKARELDRDDNIKEDYKSNRGYVKLIDKIIAEIEKLEIDRGIEPIRDDSFVAVVSCLMENDLDRVFNGLDGYLANINKCEYKEYVTDLIELSLLYNDSTFEEVMLTLSELGRDVYEYSFSLCSYEFYLQLAAGNYKKASIYLDMASMAEKIGGAKIDITNMREALVEKMMEAGLVQEAFAVGSIVMKPGVVGNKREEEPVDDFCCLADIVENVINGDCVAMLEPMSSEDVEKVLGLVGNIDGIKPVVVEQGDYKNVILRYLNKNSGYIPISDMLKRANVAYRAGLYEECIDLYETVLSKLDEPREYIYAHLGLAYYRTSNNNDFSRAIDYLTLATLQNSNEEASRYDYTELIDRLKRNSGYDGIRIKLDATNDENVKKMKHNVEKKLRY